MASETTNFLNGITNVPGTTQATLGSLVFPDPTRCHTWMDDFDDYVAAEWVVTTTGSGTVATTDADGGILAVVNSAADDAAVYSQWSGATNSAVCEAWTFDSAKSLWFKARFKLSDATQTDMVLGLIVTDTSPLDAANGMWFQKDDGSAALSLKLVNSGASTTTLSVATLTDDTYCTVGFWWDPTIGQLTVYYNDNPVASTTTTTNIPATELAISYGVQNGSVGAKTLSIDYICASKDRLENTQ